MEEKATRRKTQKKTKILKRIQKCFKYIFKKSSKNHREIIVNRLDQPENKIEKLK